MAVFEDLNGLNINGHTEQKNVGGTNLTYLSWPWAWAEVKKRYPDAHYSIWKNENGLPYTFDPLTGFMVYTSVTIDGITHEMWLPVMDGANRAMKDRMYEYRVKNPKFRYAKKQPDGRYLDSYGNEQPEYLVKACEAATMMDINKTIMRCLVKNLAMFGLGLYIYAGEDLPEAEQAEQEEQKQKATQKPQNKPDGGSVTTADKLPAEAEKAEKPAAKQPETAGEFMKRRIAEMSKEYEPWGFDFLTVRKRLIDGGEIPNVPSATMTMDQAKQLIDAVNKFYDDKRAAS